MAVTPSVVRFVCRAAIERGLRPDATGSANGASPPAVGSLMATSIASVEGAQAAADGEDEVAERRWATTLAAAAENDWRLLVCDSLEALGCIASRAENLSRAAQLLVAARQCRQDTGYLYRFGSEHDQLARTWATLGADNIALPPLRWEAAAELALSN